MRRLMALLVGVGSLVIAGAAGAEQTYTDSTGDSGTAPDVTSVVVSNDATQVTFRIAAPGRTPTDAEAHALFIDTDGNTATGDEGDEVRAFFVFPGIGVETWNGSAWVDAPTTGISGRFELGSAASTWQLTLPRTLLGTGTGFNFVVVSFKFNGDNLEAADVAPNGGSWRYELVLKQCANGRDDDGDGKIDSSDLGCSGTDDDLESDDPYTLSIGKPKATPASGKAGKPVVVRAQVRQVETSQPVASGAVRCTMKVGSTTKRSAGQLTAGTATCRLTAPKVAKTTTVRGTMTVTSKTSTVSAPFAFRVTK